MVLSFSRSLTCSTSFVFLWYVPMWNFYHIKSTILLILIHRCILTAQPEEMARHEGYIGYDDCCKLARMQNYSSWMMEKSWMMMVQFSSIIQHFSIVWHFWVNGIKFFPIFEYIYVILISIDRFIGLCTMQLNLFLGWCALHDLRLLTI